jgi:hypothetical protein
MLLKRRDMFAVECLEKWRTANCTECRPHASSSTIYQILSPDCLGALCTMQLGPLLLCCIIREASIELVYLSFLSGTLAMTTVLPNVREGNSKEPLRNIRDIALAMIFIARHSMSKIWLKLASLFNTYTTYYTGCPRRNGPDFGRVFPTLMYVDVTQNTYVQN